jgi:hypothetical protein
VRYRVYWVGAQVIEPAVIRQDGKGGALAIARARLGQSNGWRRPGR